MNVSVVMLASILIIFLSAFFIQFVFNNYYRITEICALSESTMCEYPANFPFFLFSFLVIVSFLILMESTIYMMFKQSEMELKAGAAKDKQLKSDLEATEKRKADVIKAKKDAQKKYFNRQIEEKTFNAMKEKYDTELMEIEMQLSSLREKYIKRKIGQA